MSLPFRKRCDTIKSVSALQITLDMEAENGSIRKFKTRKSVLLF